MPHVPAEELQEVEDKYKATGIAKKLSIVKE